MVAFEAMTSIQLSEYIKGKWSGPVIDASHPRPKKRIRSIDSTELPEKLTRLVNQILASEQVFDVPGLNNEPNTTLAPHTPGKMRSYHGNIDNWLPNAIVTKSTGKSRKYAEYIAGFKGQPNNLKGKAGGATGQTGYVEYTAAGWQQAIQHGRLVYNYYEDLVYFTVHYQSEWFGPDENPFVLVNWRLGLGKTDPDTVATKQAIPWALSATN